jgi:6-phosphogluconolactonase (cycloisomerase 2 family)
VVDAGDPVDSQVDDAPTFTIEDAAPSPAFFLLVTETPPFEPPPSQWGGVRRYDIEAVGATATLKSGIDKTAVQDPCGLVFRAESAELFVGDRRTSDPNGVNGSISRFRYDADSKSFSPNTAQDITGNGLGGVCQVSFSPLNGELFAANALNGGGGISRFTFDKNGNAAPNGTLGTTGMRGVVVAPDGKRLYTTNGVDKVMQFDLVNGTQLPSLPLPGGPHFMAIVANELYVAVVDADAIARYSIDGTTDELTKLDTITSDSPIAVAFSPDGREMFSASHKNANLIDRFQLTGTSWTKTGTPIDTGVSMGTIVMFPVEARPVK